MVTRDRILTTVQEFERILAKPESQDRLLELINGEIVEKIPTQEHSEVAGNIYAALRNYVKPKKIGRVGFEVRHRVPGDQYNDRLPDVSYTAGYEPVVKKGSVPQMPDLAVEVKSPDDKLPKMQAKAEYYLKNGCKIVWLVFPDTQEVTVLTSDAEGKVQSQTLTLEDTLQTGDVLAGFTLPLKDVFDV